jgi:N-alpha-acetyl-L-2,4-diaminobutyrate deacetylase
LVPLADVVLDFHSGGKTLDFVPFAAAHILENKEQERACVAAMHAFNAPYSVKLLEIDNVGMYDTAVEDQGKVFVTTELGGGGSSTAKTVAIAKKGVDNLLKHANILHGEPEIASTLELDMPDTDCFVFSEHSGLFESMIDLGEPVQKGDTVARVWSTERNGDKPVVYRAQRSGILCGRHFPGLLQAGDCISVIGVQQ